MPTGAFPGQCLGEDIETPVNRSANLWVWVQLGHGTEAFWLMLDDGLRMLNLHAFELTGYPTGQLRISDTKF